MNLLKILMQRELRLIMRTGYLLRLISLFLVLMTLFIFGHIIHSEPEILKILLLVQFLSITIFIPESLGYEYHNNTLAETAIAGRGTLLIILAKMLIYWFVNSIISLVFLIPYINYPTIGFYIGIVVATSLLITAISLFVSILTINLNRNTPLVLLIASPLYIAFLLYGTSMIDHAGTAFVAKKTLSDLKILWSFCLIIVPSSIFSCSYLLSRIE